MAGIFQVLWGTGPGEFQEAKALYGTDNEKLIIPYEGENETTKGICTRPWAVDWDSDGDLDLLVGNFEGTFFLFTGEGEGKFAPKPEQVMADGEPLRIDGAHSDPMTVDWDGDGDIDVLSGSSSGGAQWAENKADPGKIPELAPFVRILPSQRYQEFGTLMNLEDLEGPTINTRVWAADVNEDGKLDLLVGDSTALVSPAGGLNESQYKKALANWQKEFKKVSRPVDDVEKDQERREKLNDLYFQRSEFMNEDRTGFVWAYLRK
ncbi:MAG: VCBS repeat-containing protein [Verrucomicrobiota bacterium]